MEKECLGRPNADVRRSRLHVCTPSAVCACSVQNSHSTRTSGVVGASLTSRRRGTVGVNLSGCVIPIRSDISRETLACNITSVILRFES
jgi:hypothetical protein